MNNNVNVRLKQKEKLFGNATFQKIHFPSYKRYSANLEI